MAVSLNDIKTKIASTKNTVKSLMPCKWSPTAKLGRSDCSYFQVYAQKVRKLSTDIIHGNGLVFNQSDVD